MLRNKSFFPKRGEIYLVNFDPTFGSEIQKTRPSLIIQNDIANKYSPVIIVAAITSSFQTPLYPTEVFLSSSLFGLERDSVVLLNQIRTIDKMRLMQKIGIINDTILLQIDQALKLSLGLVDL